MQPTKRNTEDALRVVYRIIDNDDPEIIRWHLRELMDCYFLNVKDPTLEERDEMYYSFTLLDDVLKDMKRLPERFDPFWDKIKVDME